MNSIENEARMREALAKIAEVASTAVNGDYDSHNGHDDDPGDPSSEQNGKKAKHSCTIKSVPARLLEQAAETAVKINPVNAPAFGAVAELAIDVPLDPQRIAVLTAKYWGPLPRRLTVSFIESAPADLKTRIISHLNAWNRTAGISFVPTSGAGNVRISRGSGGYWSYLGTDVLLIPRNRPTMNLQGFTMNTPESEYKRVVRHEAGHTLGFPHEHMRRALVARIDPQKAYDYFWRTQGWNRQMVDQQVLTPLNELSIIGTPADQTSIMCYQLPGSITRDGQPILGGRDINATDYAFAGRIYPRLGFNQSPENELGLEHDHEHEHAHTYADDWDESEDEEIEVPA